MRGKQETTTIRVTPTVTQYRTKVPWVVDSGVEKSMFTEKYLGWILTKNPDTKLHRSNISF